jgi:hypothetical protein
MVYVMNERGIKIGMGVFPTIYLLLFKDKNYLLRKYIHIRRFLKFKDGEECGSSLKEFMCVTSHEITVN